MFPLKTEGAHGSESLAVFELPFVVKAVKYQDEKSNGIYELKELP